MSTKTNLTSLSLRDDDVILLNGVAFDADLVALIQAIVTTADPFEMVRIVYGGLISHLIHLPDGISRDQDTYVCIVQGLTDMVRAYVKSAERAGIHLPG